jgi:hypothetical protein
VHTRRAQSAPLFIRRKGRWKINEEVAECNQASFYRPWIWLLAKSGQHLSGNEIAEIGDDLHMGAVISSRKFNRPSYTVQPLLKWHQVTRFGPRLHMA